MAWRITKGRNGEAAPRSLVSSIDAEGHREHKVTFRVITDDVLDGPYGALQTEGLPTPGSIYSYQNDFDSEAWCRENVSMSPVKDSNQPTICFDLTYTFGTKPESSDTKNSSCETGSIKDPLLQPAKVSGNFQWSTTVGRYDRFGNPIRNSSWEPLTGPQNEWDDSKPIVVFEQNVANLQLPLVYALRKCVNDEPLWGLGRRCWKMQAFDWSLEFYGLCFRYYKRKFSFAGNEQTWDRTILDEGSKVVRGDWDRNEASPTYQRWVIDDSLNASTAHLNPKNFVQFKDWNGENAHAILDGLGSPWDSEAADRTYWWGVGEYLGGVLIVTPFEGTWDQLLLTYPTSSGYEYYGPYLSEAETTNIYSGIGRGPVTVSPFDIPGRVYVQYYPEGNFLTLGLPLTF